MEVIRNAERGTSLVSVKHLLSSLIYPKRKELKNSVQYMVGVQ